MPVQNRGDIDTTPFILFTRPAYREDDAVILQDAGRVADLLQYTLMGKAAATGKWEPFTDETDVTGLVEVFGVYMGEDIATADLVAGDVADSPIITSGINFDAAKLVIENAKTLDTVIGAATIAAHTVRDALREVEMIAIDTQTASAAENA